MRINNIIKSGLTGLAVLACGAAVADKGELTQADVWLQPVKGGYSVEFVSNGDVAGLQFDVKGIKVTEGQFDCGTGLASSHMASCSITSDGSLRVIVFSMENAPVPDGTMAFIRSAASGDRANLLRAAANQAAEPSLGGVVFADAQGANVTPDHLK